MDPNITSLERAFELARSGACASVRDIRHRLAAEGYAQNQIDGPRLIQQLRELCEAAAGAAEA
jgi:hypothetical protein